MKLILCEKPSVARDFAKALGKARNCEGHIECEKYIITWSYGHLLELKIPQQYDKNLEKWAFQTLPILPPQMEYRPTKDGQKQLTHLKKIFHGPNITDFIVATDAGREGELIARTIFEYVKAPKHPVWRFWTAQALTKDVIVENLKGLQPWKAYDGLFAAGQSRQWSDWLVGVNLTRAVSIKMGELNSVGRVQTAVLSLLVDRLLERKKFERESFWHLKGNFDHKLGQFEGIYWKDGHRLEEKKVQELMKSLPRVGLIKNVSRKINNKAAPQLYSLTDLQRDANNILKFSAKKTLTLAQALYERHKVISYPRSDSKVMGEKNKGLVEKIVNKMREFRPEYFKNFDANLVSLSNKLLFNDELLTDHHAIIPLGPFRGTQDEGKLYDLILRRFVAALSSDYVTQLLEIKTLVGDEVFLSKGTKVVKEGYRHLTKSWEKLPDHNIPDVKSGENVKILKWLPEKKETNPPPHYTEALLLKDMVNPARLVEEKELKKVYRGEVGLGTQSTRAQIIETLLFRKFLSREKRQLVATEKGVKLIGALRSLPLVKRLATPKETAMWEIELSDMSKSPKKSVKFLEDIKEFVDKSVRELENGKLINSRALCLCPLCKKNVFEAPKSYSCEGWRDKSCGLTIWKVVASKKIGPEVAIECFKNKKGPFIKDFLSTKGKNFGARLVLDEKEKKFIFNFRE